MAINNFDINTLFRTVFGFGRGKPFDQEKIIEREVNAAEPFPDQIESSDEEGTEFIEIRNTIDARTPLGTAIFMPVRLGGLLLPNEPTVLIQGRKRIVQTALTGSTRKGSVKELISTEDYQVTIRGIALNYDSMKVYPEDIVKDLNDLYLRNESLVIESALTNLLGIYRLVIEQITFPEMIGIQHAQAYELKCMSDEDFILEIE